MRHLVWLTMFAVLALLPLAALLLPPRQLVLPVAPPAAMESITAPELVPQAVMLPPVTVAAPTLLPRPLLTRENYLLLLVLLWAAGLAWNLGRMALGGIGLLRLRRQSDVFGMADAPCELRLSPQVSGPSTFGLLRPVILLPQAARDWNRTRLEAVLAHEAAHVRRRDAANQLLVRLVCAVYWLNPLLWLAAGALRREAELAADDAALISGLTPSTYAAELVALAARVQSVLAANASRKGVTRMDMLKTATVGLAVTLLLGAARFDFAVAQDEPVNTAPLARPGPAAPPINPAPEAHPAPAAPPGNVAPKVDVEINRNVESKVDIEVEAVKARADAVAAQARARAEAEKDPARRAQYREEAARVAAEAAEAKARAEQTRQRGAQVAQQAREVQQEILETKQRALEVEQRALAARAQADEIELRTRGGQARTLRSGSRVQMTTKGDKSVTLSTDRVRAEARPFAAPAPAPAGDSPFGATFSGVGPSPFAAPLGVQGDKNNTYFVRGYSRSSNDVNVGATINVPNIDPGNSEMRARIDAVIKTAMDEAARKIDDAVAAARAAAPKPN